MDPITLKLIMAAGGAGGAAAPYVEDVFCIDTYTGFGAGYDSPFASGLTTNYGKDGYYSTFFSGPSYGTGSVLDGSAHSSFQLSGNFTVEMWVKGNTQTGGGSPGYPRLWQLDGPSGNSYVNNLQITINPNNQTLHTWSTGSGSGSSIALVGSVNIMDGNWHHVCVERATIGGTTDIITQYVDGVPDGSSSQNQTIFNPNSGSPRMRWGVHDGINAFYIGYISNFRMWIGGSQYVNNQPAGTTFSRPTEPFDSGSFLCMNKSEVNMHSNQQSGFTLTAASSGVTGGGQYPKTGRRICDSLDFTEGGLLWMKNLVRTDKHRLYDTERDIKKVINSAGMDEEGSAIAGGISHWTTNGATHTVSGDPTWANLRQENQPAETYVGWGFRKSERFFDVIKWDGNNVSGRTINHNLKCEPGVIIVKCLTASYGWQVYHRSLATTGSNGKDATSWLRLDTADQASTANTPGFNNVNEDSFDVGSYVAVNGSTQKYIAYVFAHDDAANGVIKCGTYTGNSGVNRIELGWEPQYLMIKRSDGSAWWWIYDTQRDGLRVYNRGSMNEGSSGGSILYANETNTTDQTFDISPDATGFNLPAVGGGNNANSDNFVYIAIRRGPMKAPTDATTVFNASKGAAPYQPTFHAKFPSDVTWSRQYGTGGNWRHNIRAQGIVSSQSGSRMNWDTNANPIAEADYKGDQMKGAWTTSSSGSGYIGYMMRRAPKFFDTVGYVGNAGSTDVNVERAINHNLTVKPEIIIIRSTGNSGGNTDNQTYQTIKNCGTLPSTAAAPFTGVDHNAVKQMENGSSNWENGTSALERFGSSVDTETQFYLGTHQWTNRSNYSYIAQMWATCPEVSKVGYYVGTGADKNISCGFTGNARLVIINQWNNSSWYTYDSVRGITSGNDPFLNWAYTDAENSNYDYIDPYTGGFRVTSEANTTINVVGHYYTFIAIA